MRNEDSLGEDTIIRLPPPPLARVERYDVSGV
jgi:hypothetical protein